MYIDNNRLKELAKGIFQLIPNFDNILLKFSKKRNNLKSSADLKDCYNIYYFIELIKDFLDQLSNVINVESKIEQFLQTIFIEIHKDMKPLKIKITEMLDI